MGRLDDLRFVGSDTGLDLDVVVEVRRRTTPRVKITPKPPSPSAPPLIDHIAWRKQLLAGDLEPGTYRVGNWALGRYDLVTIPSRQPRWVRTPLGRLWHRVRYMEIFWTFAGRRRDVPGVHIETWCGMSANATRNVGDQQPRLADDPGQPICGRCDTSVPDPRRYPDRPALNGALPAGAPERRAEPPSGPLRPAESGLHGYSEGAP